LKFIQFFSKEIIRLCFCNTWNCYLTLYTSLVCFQKSKISVCILHFNVKAKQVVTPSLLFSSSDISYLGNYFAYIRQTLERQKAYLLLEHSAYLTLLIIWLSFFGSARWRERFNKFLDLYFRIVTSKKYLAIFKWSCLIPSLLWLN
jgi:hypothetical protein